VRTVTLVLAACCILSIPPCHGQSYVIHSAAHGIIAFSYENGGGNVLDSMGHVWSANLDGQWSRRPLWDPPLPPENIKFWQLELMVTTDNEMLWFNQNNEWSSLGHWPGLADVEPIADPTAKSMVAPNPSPGPCRVSFQVATEGPVTVEVIDVTGRVLRRLLDGPHPAGDYSVIWDGRDDGGRDVPSGTYWTRITAPGGTTTGRIALVK
jgi:hypothetical protein